MVSEGVRIESTILCYDQSSFEDWIPKALVESDEESFCTFAISLWMMWFARNVLVFQGKKLHVF